MSTTNPITRYIQPWRREDSGGRGGVNWEMTDVRSSHTNYQHGCWFWVLPIKLIKQTRSQGKKISEVYVDAASTQLDEGDEGPLLYGFDGRWGRTVQALGLRDGDYLYLHWTRAGVPEPFHSWPGIRPGFHTVGEYYPEAQYGLRAQATGTNDTWTPSSLTWEEVTEKTTEMAP